MAAKKSKSSNWIDVTIPVRSGMLHWPGDVSVKVEKKQDMTKGDRVTLSTLSLGAHTGTHMDAPMHFIKGGKSLDELPFEATVGVARVIEVEDPVSVKIDDLKPLGIRKEERILFKTRNSTVDWHLEKFKEDFVFISQAAARYLVDRKVQTVGIDYLSVGGFKVDGLETHNHLLGAGIWVIEGLDLSKVKPGRYQMICLPLRLQNTEGSPARVILKKLN